MPRDQIPMVILVGTSHSIQLGIGVSGEVTGKFRAFLERVCLTQGVCAVAEEMNAEALAERNCSSSIPQQLAASLNLQHRFCDPNRCERAIRAKALLSDLPEAEISSRVAESYQKREQYWLGHLRALNCWPVLFVCGADHVVSFCAQLEREGIAKLVKAQDWIAG